MTLRLLPAAAAAVSPVSAGTPDLLPLLSRDYATGREAILDGLRAALPDPCAGGLTIYARQPDARVRESSVRALSDLGCGRFEAYAPFRGDASPWVAEALLDAIERHLIGDAVPFLLERLSDPRTVLGGSDTYTLGERAHRVLRTVSCQSFHLDPEGSALSRSDAVAQWRAWYRSHQREPRRAWETAGIALALDYLGRGYPAHRLEGLRLLALIGPPARAALVTALRRPAGSLGVGIDCYSDEPLRVIDRRSCILAVMNVSERPVALASGEPRVVVEEVTGARRPPPGRNEETEARRSPAAGGGAADRELLSLLTDLAPGEILRWDLTIGPVEAAGHYRVRVILPSLLEGEPDLSAETAIQFGQ